MRGVAITLRRQGCRLRCWAVLHIVCMSVKDTLRWLGRPALVCDMHEDCIWPAKLLSASLN